MRTFTTSALILAQNLINEGLGRRRIWGNWGFLRFLVWEKHGSWEEEAGRGRKEVKGQVRLRRKKNTRGRGTGRTQGNGKGAQETTFLPPVGKGDLGRIDFLRTTEEGRRRGDSEPGAENLDVYCLFNIAM